MIVDQVLGYEKERDVLLHKNRFVNKGQGRELNSWSKNKKRTGKLMNLKVKSPGKQKIAYGNILLSQMKEPVSSKEKNYWQNMQYIRRLENNIATMLIS